MKRTSALLVVLAVTVALTAVLVLYLAADKKANHHYTSFERNFVPIRISFTDSLDLKYTGYYLAGRTGHTIYLSRAPNPSRLIAVNETLRDTTHYILRVDTDSLKYRAIRVTVDSPYYYMADGTQPFIYKGVLGEKATPWITDIRFTKAIPLSHRSAAMVVIRNMENTIVKKVNNIQPELYPDILEEQGEGIFSTDGMMRYDHENKRLVYLYFYRNQYMVMDTSFQIIQQGHTIDTVSKAKIKTARISSQKSVTMKAPPLKVNNDCSVHKNTLYVHSNLLAKNEDPTIFEKAAVIDVYHLTGQRYLHSFYLPSYHNKNAREFLITDNDIYAIYETYLVHYRISLKDTIAQ